MQGARPSPRCQITPPTFCRAWPEPLAGQVERDVMLKPMALATECLAPTLVLLRRTAARLEDEATPDRRARNARWMYFLAFAGILGGKLAGATLKLAALDDRPPAETRRVRGLRRRVVAGIRRATRRIVTTIGPRPPPPPGPAK